MAAYLAHAQSRQQKFLLTAADHLEKASSTSMAVRWLAGLRSKLLVQPLAAAASVYPTQDWFRQINDLLTDWGVRGGKYARSVAAVEADLRSSLR